MIQSEVPPAPDGTLEDAPISRAAAFRSAGWAISGSILRYLLAGITTLILIRLLSPDALGLFAITNAAQLLIGHIASVGFHDAIIQRRNLTHEDLDTAFWSIMASASSLAAIIMLIAWPVAQLYDEPRLAPLLAGVSFAALLRAPGMPARALLNRRMDFRAIVLMRLAAMMIASIGAIVLAWAGGGPWSLIAHMAIFNITVTVLVWHITGWRPRWRISRSTLRAVWRFAPSVAIFTVTAHIVGEADNQLIGYRLGAESLGYYVLAYQAMVWPTRDVLGGMGIVLYPIFSRLQDDLPRFQRTYIEATQLAGLFAFPVLMFLAITAPVIVPAALGAKWSPAVLTLQILAIGGIRSATMMLNGTIYRALGHPELHTMLGLVNVVCYIPAFVIGLAWGIEGVALLYVVTGALLHPVSLWLVLGTMKLSVWRWLNAYLPALVGTLVMAPLSAWTLHAARARWETPAPALLVTLAASVVSYSVIVVLWRPSVIKQSWRMVRRSVND